MKGTGKSGFSLIISALLASTFFLTSFSASAETDMRKIKCGDFSAIMQSNEHQQEVAGSLFIGFLWGLYKGEDEPPVIGTPSDTEKLAQLAKFCAANPAAGLMKAVDQLWEKD